MQVGWPMGRPDAMSWNWDLSGEISELDTHSSDLPKCHAEFRKGINNLVINLSFTPPSTWQGLTSPKDKLSHWSINFQNVEWQCSLIISIHVSEMKNGISLLIDGRSNLASGSGHEDWRSSWLHTAHFPINRFETAGPVFLQGYIRYIPSIHR